MLLRPANHTACLQPSPLPPCLQVGGAAAGRNVHAVADRCLALMQRYQENQRRKRAAAAAAAAATAGAAS